MPRKSPEARAAAAIAATRPKPPVDLPPAAAKLWTDIVADRAPGYFDPGSQPLLKAYVRCLVFLENAEVGSAPHRRLLSCAMTLATKLRLTVQANVHRRAGILDEKPRLAPFLGGSLVTFRRPNDV
jgi:hypothetical protein